MAMIFLAMMALRAKRSSERLPSLLLPLAIKKYINNPEQGDTNET